MVSDERYIYHVYGDHDKDLITLYAKRDEVVYGYAIESMLAGFPDADSEYSVRFLGNEFDGEWMSYKDGLMVEHIEYYGGGTFGFYYDSIGNMFYDFDGVLDGWQMMDSSSGRSVLYFVKPACCDSGECKCENGIVQQGKFSSYISGNGMNKFGGTGVAVGVYDGHWGRATKRVFFTNQFIDDVVRKYGRDPTVIKVDWNHDGNYVGQLFGLEVKKNPVYRVFMRGDAGRPVPSGAGLSIEFSYGSRWNEEFKVFEAVNPVIKAVSVLTEQNPGCKICYTK